MVTFTLRAPSSNAVWLILVSTGGVLSTVNARLVVGWVLEAVLTPATRACKTEQRYMYVGSEEEI